MWEAGEALTGKPEGRRPLGRPGYGQEDNIDINLKEVRWDVDWIDLAQDRDRWHAVVNVVMTLRFP
jgi:hypothetical protein